jgi:hypothetical protein
MCRNIKQLRHQDRPPTDEELHDAALQFVRKLSGFRAPSRANQEAFEEAVDAVAAAARTMFQRLRVRVGTRALVD